MHGQMVTMSRELTFSVCQTRSVRFLSIIFLITYLFDLTKSVPCGPKELCSCVLKEPMGFVQMDCSNTAVSLKDVCNFTDRHSNISTIIVNRVKLSFVRETDLTGCEKLDEFHLRNTSLVHIDLGAFRGMDNLVLLDLSWNMLDIYSNGTDYLNDLTSLRELRLQGNLQAYALSSLSYPPLSSHQQLETLFIDGLYNTAFNYDYLHLTKLSYIKLSGYEGICNLGELTNFTFQSLPYLNKLDLSDCNVTNIYAGAFKMLHRLTWLDLSLNQQIGFKPLRNITYSLQFTQIDFLNISKVHNTFGLGTEMRRDDICFIRNTTLRELVLDSNRLQLFETNLFLMMPQTLQILHVNDNIFTFGLYLLQAACLNNLTTAYAGFQNFAHAPLLYLNDPVNASSSRQPHSEGCIYSEPSYLKNVSLEIGCRYFETEKVSKRDLYLVTFPKTLKTVTLHDSSLNYRILGYPVLPFNNHFENIDMSGNILYSWVGPIGPFPNIKTLNMSKNYCSYISLKMFIYMTNLQQLYIGENFLGLPLANDIRGEIFEPLTNLEVLDLSANQIRDIPSSIFIHLKSLQMLNVSFNSISSWTINVQTMPSLDYLDIQSNALSELPQSLTSHFDELSLQRHQPFRIDMRNNPIQCSCKHERFLRWMVKHKTSFVWFESYTFTNETGKPLTAAECIEIVEDFSKSCRSFTWLIVLVSVGFTLFISLIVCGLVYKNRWKLRYMLYMNKRRFFGYRAVPGYEPIENYKYDAFISYAEENIRFIRDGIIPNLEEKGLELIIHQRDFIAGNPITDNIINAIQCSRKTVIILSEAFLKSTWCLYEFHMSRMESIYSRDGKSSLVVVMYEHMPPNKLMPLEMIEWIKQESYLEYTVDAHGNVLFWDQLKDAIMQ